MNIVPRSGQGRFLIVVTLRVYLIITWIPAFAGMTAAIYASVMNYVKLNNVERSLKIFKDAVRLKIASQYKYDAHQPRD